MKKRFKNRPLSWSQLSSFSYNPEEWYKSYILGVRSPANPAMLFGSEVGKKLETDPSYLPEIPRYGKMEYEYHVNFNGIPMIGFADTQCDKTNTKIGEYKTGKHWDQKKVDNHGQLTMYAMQNLIQNKINPEDTLITLHWMPTEEKGDFSVGFKEPLEVQHFTTTRTMQDVLEFGAYINRTVKEMDEFIKTRV